jgi:hypothetical protein
METSTDTTAAVDNLLAKVNQQVFSDEGDLKSLITDVASFMERFRYRLRFFK